MAEAPRVLIVDDEPSILMALTLAFEGEGWRIATAASAELALPLLDARPHDIYLIDKNLPGRSGIELAREIRKRSTDARIIIITGYGSYQSATDALNVGIDAYLEKPFHDIYQVAKTVRDLLAVRPDPAAPRTAGKTLTVLSASLSSRARAHMVALLDEKVDRILLAGAVREIHLAVSRAAPDVVILDGASYGEQLVDLTAELRTRAPHSVFIVVAKSLALPIVKRLIQLQVKSFVDRAPDEDGSDRKVREVVEQHRSRRAIQDLMRTGSPVNVIR